MKSFLFLLIICMGICRFTRAQKTDRPLPGKIAAQQGDTTVKTPGNKQLFINPGFSYISNLTYEGRKAANSAPVLTPYVNLILRQGFFLSATGYVNAARKLWGMEGAGITPGYVFQLGKHFDGYLSGTKYFFEDSSSLILSSLQGSADAGINFQCRILNAGLSLDYLIGSTNDLIAGATLGKTLKWKEIFPKVSLTAEPAVSLSAGTQSFYETYYTHSVVNKSAPPVQPVQEGPLGSLLGDGRQDSGNPVPLTETISEKKRREIRRFGLLNAGCYLPLTIHFGKLSVDFTPNMVFPFNEVNLGGEKSSGGPPVFFYSAGVSVVL